MADLTKLKQLSKKIFGEDSTGYKNMEDALEEIEIQSEYNAKKSPSTN